MAFEDYNFKVVDIKVFIIARVYVSRSYVSYCTLTQKIIKIFSCNINFSIAGFLRLILDVKTSQLTSDVKTNNSKGTETIRVQDHKGRNQRKKSQVLTPG